MRTFPGARTERVFCVTVQTMRMLTGALVAALVAVGGSAAAVTHRQPADSPTPTAGECETTSARYVQVDVEQDAPDPRCWQVRPGQRLRVRDDLHEAVRLRWRPYATVTLHAGQTITFRRPFASYLQPGDHHAWISAYAGGGGFEVVLPNHRRQAPPPAGG